MFSICPSLKHFFLSLGPLGGWWPVWQKMILIGLVLGTVFYFGAEESGIMRSVTELPEVQKVLKKLDEEIPKEARSLENLIPMAQMAFDAIDKYSKLNQD